MSGQVVMAHNSGSGQQHNVHQPNVHADTVHSITVNNGSGPSNEAPKVSLKLAIPTADGSSASCNIELPWSYFAYPSRAETDQAIGRTAAIIIENISKTVTPVQAVPSNKRKRENEPGPSSYKRAKREYPYKHDDECDWISLSIRCSEKGFTKEVFMKKTQNLYQCVDHFIDECNVALVCIRLFYGAQLIDNGDTAEDVESLLADGVVTSLNCCSSTCEMMRLLTFRSWRTLEAHRPVVASGQILDYVDTLCSPCILQFEVIMLKSPSGWP